MPTRRTRPEPSRPVRTAALAEPAARPLPELDTSIPPWPGDFQSVAGTKIFIRRTPAATDAASAEPALYVHGLGGASTNFTDLAHLLAHHVDGHALDLPGFGQSSPPLHDDYSIQAHSRVVIRYLEQSDRGPVHLVGNSMGGAISIRVAARRPDLVKTLTLVSPAVPDLRPRTGSDALLPLVMVPRLGNWLMSRLAALPAERRARDVIELCFAHPEKVPENRLAEATADVAARRDLPWADSAMVSSLRGLVATYLARGERSPWAEMASISAPTAIIWGDQDRLVAVGNATRVAATIPDATLLVLPDIGHVAQLEDPIRTAQLILGLLERANAGRSRAGMGG